MIIELHAEATKGVPSKFVEAPRVSVIMAVYNGERFLAEAIESILNQTLLDFEFIIVNDASTDNTEAIVRTYLEKDSRIKLINNDVNSERSVSRNKGIEMSSGKYISVIDADDICLPEKLEKQVQFLDAHQDVGLVGTAFYSIDEKGKELSFHPSPKPWIREAIHFTCFPSIMVRKSCLDAVGAYRALFEPAEDYDLWMRVSEKYGVGNISEPLFRYRVHGESSTAKQKLQMDVGTSLALEMSEERRRTGTDKVSVISHEEAMRIKDHRIRLSGFKKRKMFSYIYSAWGLAAFKVGDYERAYNYAKQAICSYMLTGQAWIVMTRALIKSVRV